MRPSIIPKGIASKSTSKLAQQGWLKSGNCPEGTIPIRRTLKSDLVRAMSVSTMAPLTSDGASSVQQVSCSIPTFQSQNSCIYYLESGSERLDHGRVRPKDIHRYIKLSLIK